MPTGKIKTREELRRIIQGLKTEGKKVAHTSGSYDIIHAGHISTLEQAKSHGDVLIVSINNDESVRRFKGKNRPILNEDERAALLSALACVDYVTIFPEDTVLKTLEALKPDVHVKGGTYIKERVEAEKKLLQSWGGEMKFVKLVEGKSTTGVIQRIIDAYKGEGK